MECWSSVMADMQSANCRSNNAPAARNTNSLFPVMLYTLYGVFDAPVKNSLFGKSIAQTEEAPAKCIDRLPWEIRSRQLLLIVNLCSLRHQATSSQTNSSMESGRSSRGVVAKSRRGPAHEGSLLLDHERLLRSQTVNRL